MRDSKNILPIVLNNEQSFKSLGFTLIELMVSLGLLVVAIMAAMGIYLSVIGTRQKTLGQVNIQEDGQYLISLMIKDIRFGSIDYANYGPTAECGEIDTDDGWVNQLCLLDLSNNKVRYKSDLSAQGVCGSNRCVIKRCKGTSCSSDSDFQTITMQNISLERLDFYINPTTDPLVAGSTTYRHPRVTIILKLKSLIEKTGEKELVIQQTVPQRYTRRK